VKQYLGGNDYRAISVVIVLELMHNYGPYIHQVRTGALAHVHDTLLSAKVNVGSCLSVKWNVEVQLYDGISLPLANVTTSTCNVPPSRFLDVVNLIDELLRNEPAADSQWIDADISACTLDRLS